MNARIAELVALEPIKVWSLIVTLFGDLAQQNVSYLSGRDLRTRLDPIGIKAETVRVALHRLGREDWISTRKVGREVEYSLSQKGQNETAEVCDDVYRHDLKYSDGWILQLHQPGVERDYAAAFEIVKHVTIAPRDGSRDIAGSIAMPLDRNTVPDWLMERVLPQSVEALAQAYLTVLLAIEREMEHASAEDKVSLRLLCLHRWRRMALHDTTWCHIWLKPDGVMSMCHTTTTRLLNGVLKA